MRGSDETQVTNQRPWVMIQFDVVTWGHYIHHNKVTGALIASQQIIIGFN